MGIVGYQLLIAGAILFAAGYKGFKGLGIAVAVAILWTSTHVFMAWLALIQLGTIVVSGIVGVVVAIIHHLVKQE